MRSSSLLATGFLGILAVFAVLLSTRVAESRTQRTLARAELYEVLGGQQFQDYCCLNTSNCYTTSISCSDKNGTDQETCETWGNYTVVQGNVDSCSSYEPGLNYSCSQSGSYQCSIMYSCIWMTGTKECDSNTYIGSYYAPQSCLDTCVGHND